MLCATTGVHLASAASPSGCWVQLNSDDPAEAGDVFHGPGQWASLVDVPGATHEDWGDDLDRVVVGPRARVQVWEDENFQNASSRLSPGESADLGDVESLAISCVQPSRPRSAARHR
jgi:hypothetical protein